MKVSAVKSFFPVSKRVSFLRPRLVLFIILGVSQIVVSCDAREQVRLIVGNESFIVEVADSPDERARGLMHRRTLAMDRGMLFVFPYDQRVSFWMKNTLVPLSVAYISQNGTIREIHRLTPLSETPVSSSRSVRFALELREGAFERAGAGVGTVIEGLPLP